MRDELDVHPDDLLHRVRSAQGLSPGEQAYVDAHLRDCDTCRFMLQAGRAFDAEAAEPSLTKLDRGAVDRLVARTLRQTGMDRARRWRPSPAWPAARGRRLAVAGLVAALMLGGVAFAGYWGVR
ncbi:MAG TPA: hypothetical protein VHO67_02860, partial [Polyangia bacterium]|nr:hypothetical protein [Polyangia bacterium]